MLFRSVRRATIFSQTVHPLFLILMTGALFVTHLLRRLSNRMAYSAFIGLVVYELAFLILINWTRSQADPVDSDRVVRKQGNGWSFCNLNDMERFYLEREQSMKRLSIARVRGGLEIAGFGW